MLYFHKNVFPLSFICCSLGNKVHILLTFHVHLKDTYKGEPIEEFARYVTWQTKLDQKTLGPMQTINFRLFNF